MSSERKREMCALCILHTSYPVTSGASDDPEEEGVLKDVECRDLSAWRISLPRLEPRNDPITGKACFVFIIQVGTFL